MPSFAAEPITFQAQLLDFSSPELAQAMPSARIQAPPPRKKSKAYIVRYTLPAAGLSLTPESGKQKIVVDMASIQLDDVGSLLDKHAEELVFTLPGDQQLSQIHRKSIVIHQLVNLGKEDKYLYLAIWDPANGKTGPVQVPIEIPK